MPSTYTDRNRLEMQAAGENNNTWGTRLNDNVIDLIDESTDGITAFTLSGSKTLTSNNAATDESRKRVLHITGGTGGTVTVPNLEKCYLVRNASSGTVTFTTGSGTTADILTGTSGWIFSTGSNEIYAAAANNFGANTVSAGGFLASSTGGVGYTTGAGGTVTQLTSKSTAVTLNAMSGAITMHGAALAANTTVQFILNNSRLSANDILVLQQKSGTNGSYNIWPSGTTAASTVICVRNISAGSLSEAVQIYFAIIKGATS